MSIKKHTRDIERAARHEVNAREIAAGPIVSNSGQAAYVQRARAERTAKQAGATDAGHVHAAAQRGIAGPSTELPHRDRIQESFGKHDVSGIQAHVGGEAKAAAESMGAKAYATGSDVSFAQQPDLHTAAHEAAHVVQQAGGVQLSGGVGQAGDAYEQHADRVADKVVAGESAEAELDEMASDGAMSRTNSAVQKNDMAQDAFEESSFDDSCRVDEGFCDASVDEDYCEPVNKPEEKGAWNSQWVATKDSFYDLVDKHREAATSFQTLAKVTDLPSGWEQALHAIVKVLTSALQGVAGFVAGQVALPAAQWAIETTLKSAIEAGIDRIDAPSGELDEKRALEVFCEQQRFAMIDAAKAARGSFTVAAGTFTNQQMSMGEMYMIQQANEAAAETKQAETIQHRNMLIGWMNLLAGDRAVENSNLERSSKGVLSVMVAGFDDRATVIRKAEAKGINKELRAKLAGTTLGEWVNPGGQDGVAGLDIMIRTGFMNEADSFEVSHATMKQMFAAGVRPEDLYTDEDGRHKFAISFAIGQERNGGKTWVDLDSMRGEDSEVGATAGRWFLENVRTIEDIIGDVAELTLPDVDTDAY